MQSSQSLTSDHMEVNMPNSSLQPTLSDDVLQEFVVECQVKCNQWCTNGNQFLRVQHKTGAPLDKLCARLVIVCVEPKTKGSGTVTVFYCIGCDQWRSNNAHSCALPHSKNCKVCEINLHLMLSYTKLINGHQLLQHDDVLCSNLTLQIIY
jgi:hypothetical protein